MASACNDQLLLEKPEKPFSPLVMFTCTFESRVGNISRSHKELTDVLGPMIATGSGPIKALNSNFGHYCQPGYEKYIKSPKPVLKKTTGKIAPIPIRQRKPQGDATCFNSALEIIIVPDKNSAPEKMIKIFEEKKPSIMH